MSFSSGYLTKGPRYLSFFKLFLGNGSSYFIFVGIETSIKRFRLNPRETWCPLCRAPKGYWKMGMGYFFLGGGVVLG